MRIRPFAELTTPDDRSLRFTSMGFATGGRLSPEDATEFQQRSIASADLVPAVPEGTRSSFERLRTLHAYGVLCYDTYTVVDELRWIVLEQALRERFIEFYEQAIPLLDSNGSESVLPAFTFEVVSEAFRPGGSHAKGWHLKLRSQQTSRPVPLTLQPLLRWARQEGLLHGQRNRRVEEELYGEIRNVFAHGGGFQIGMPNQSARGICDLAEVINRLWGVPTPGGRLHPAPLQREVLVIGWSPGWAQGNQGASVTVMHAEQLAGHDEPDDWTYLVVLGIWHDQQLWDFDAQYELTTYPTDLLWGPGTRKDALAWLAATAPAGDEVTHLDRVFAIRRHSGKTYLPCRPEVLLALPADARAGTWHLVRADFPTDAFVHIRHLDAGQPCQPPRQRYGGCAVEDLAEGAWAQVVATLSGLYPDLQAAQYTEAHAPRRWPFPDSMGR